MVKHLNIRVRGLVQGVNFRYECRVLAGRLGLKGFVRNEDTRQVYIEAEGEESNLLEFVKWCNKGPEMAEVEAVEINEGPLSGFIQFKIKY